MKITGSAIIIAALAAAVLVSGQDACAQPGCDLKPSKTVLLYPEGQDSGKGLQEAWGPGESNGITEQEFTEDNGNISNITEARFDLYFPEKTNGQMVIVCPGGGYGIVSSYNEGVYVADRMTEHGVTVAVAKYRLPNGHWTVPLTDVQNTFRYCRAHASEWGVRQIGVMGFSAGGHLAASATTLYSDKETRPDFSILIYPVISLDWSMTHGGTRTNLIGEDNRWQSRQGKDYEQWTADKAMHGKLVEKYSLENNVTPDTPPVFLAHCTDDSTVPVQNSIDFYMELVKNGVPAEMHIFPYGGHGWGFSTVEYTGYDGLGYARSEFEASLFRWMDSMREK